MKTILIMGSLSLIGILMSCAETPSLKSKTITDVKITKEVTPVSNEVLEDDSQAEVMQIAPVEEEINLEDIPWMKEMLHTPKTPELNLESMFNSIEKQLETQSLSLNRDTVLTFSEGTKLTIKANSFVDEFGMPINASKVDVSLGEYYALEDLIASNLSTQTADGLLETGGTVFVEATANGNKCRLKDGASIEIQFPTKSVKSGMQLFAGNEVNDQIIWQPTFTDYDYNQIIEFVDEEAQFPGGNVQLMGFISSNVDYPSISIQNNEQGRVFLQFEVATDGSIKNIKVTRSVSELLDQEAIRVIESMPNWEPARMNGRNVRTRIRLPIVFQLDGGDVGVRNPSETELSDAYRKSFEARFTGEDPSGIRMDEVSSYVLSTSKLGWINCDRFINSNAERSDFVIYTGSTKNENVKIVFKNRRAVMQANVDGEAHVFSKIPVNEPVFVIGVKVVRGECYFAMKETTTNRNPDNYLNYKKCTLDELQSAMARLQW